MIGSSTRTASEGSTHHQKTLTEAWSYYQLPIFYTLQPNPPTRQKQIALWADILVQSAIRQCAIHHQSLREWEEEESTCKREKGDLSGASTSPAITAPPPPPPPLGVRSVLGKTDSKPNDKCPFVALYTADDELFVNTTLNRRLPRAAVPLVFQAAMMMYPSLCVSNVPLTSVIRSQYDENTDASTTNAHQQQGKPAIDEKGGRQHEEEDGMAGWLSTLFGGSNRKNRGGEKGGGAGANIKTPQAQQETEEIEGKDEEEEVRYWLAVFANDGGHVSVMSDHIMRWVIDVGGGLTTANLKKNGVVTTFDEMAAENALVFTPRSGAAVPVAIAYVPPSKGMPQRLRGVGLSHGSAQPPSAGKSVLSQQQHKMANSVSNEHVLRLLLHFYQHSPAATPIAKITLFNLDDSDRQPYDGIKFGGSGD